MSELGIFIDESGFFEKGSKNINVRDLYIVSFVFHNKAMSIIEDIKAFEEYLILHSKAPFININTY